MSSPALYPKFRAVDPSTGLALVGGKLYTYAAGTTTPQATYADSALATPNANPIILDANGEATIYCGALAYKFVLQKSDGSAVWTFDNYSPNISSLPSGAQWVSYSGAVTWINGTSFKATGADVTTTFSAGRRVRSSNTAGTVYSTVLSSTFASGDTTVTLINDGTSALDSGFASPAYGILSYSNPSYLDPRTLVYSYLTSNQALTGTPAQLTGFTEFIDTLNEFSGGTFTAKYPGYYLISAKVMVSDSGAAGQQMLAEVYINGSSYARTRVNSRGANLYDALDITFPVSLAAGDTVKLYAYGTATTTAYGGGGPTMTTFTIARLP